MTITIRLATPDDYAAFCDLNAQIDALHREQEPTVFRKAIPSRDRPYFEIWLADPARRLLMAESEGRVVGLVMAEVVHTPNFPILKPRAYVHVDTLVVDANAQRQGIGQALMGAVHEWAEVQGIHEVQLGVWAFNQGAITFYEQLGYTPFIYRMVRRRPADE